MNWDMKLSKGIAIGFLISILVSICLAWTYTWDCATPVGTDAPSVIDDRIREAKYATEERLNVDHYFPLTGTQVSDTAAGQHRQVEFYAPISTPTNATDKGFIYTKDVSAKAELHFEDEDGHEIQLTDTGSFNVALLTSKTLTTPTLTTPTLTSPVINTGVSGTAVLDEDDMATDSSTQLATQQSIKAYVDTKTAFGTLATKSQNVVYQADTDGFVYGYSATNVTIKGYTDSSNPPTTQVQWGYSNAGIASIMFPVNKNDYWEVTGAIALYWMPFGN